MSGIIMLVFLKLFRISPILKMTIKSVIILTYFFRKVLRIEQCLDRF